MPRSGSLLALVVVAAMTQGGCAFVPKTNPRLDEARDTHRVAAADARIAELAPAELEQANEVLERAIRAWNTLDDPAEVDHLAYLAKQRIAIAHEAAQRLHAESDLVAARSEHALLLASSRARLAQASRPGAVAINR